MHGAWIYFNERRGVWEVKRWEDGGAKVLFEYRTRGDAYRCAAWGIVN